MIESPAAAKGASRSLPDAVPSRLSSGQTTFGVVGLGYVALPLAVRAAGRGVSVLGFDVDPGVVDGVNRGRSHISDLTDEEGADARRTGGLEATAEMARLGECDAISICVPTPLSRTRDPDIAHILAASEAVAASLGTGQLIVLESTTYPGTTREVVLPILRRGGLAPGRDFFLCFSPERVAPG
ncbi:MAG: hypothetical protein F4187_00300, partial [Gemmatimonadetes bacterium]|nr:hypothetical protein [Gemmatimonadota bacterium]